MTTNIKCAACLILKEFVVRSFPADVVTYRGFSLCNKHARAWMELGYDVSFERFMKVMSENIVEDGPVKPGPNKLKEQREKMAEREVVTVSAPELQKVVGADGHAELVELPLVDPGPMVATPETETLEGLTAKEVASAGGTTEEQLHEMVDVLEEKPKKGGGKKRRRKKK